MGKKNKPSKTGSAKEKQAATFNDIAAVLVNTVYAVLLGLKGRTGGAQEYGADGLFICAVEALHTARASKNLEDFLKSAAYSIAAAMKAGGVWDYQLAAPEGPNEAVERAVAEKENDNDGKTEKRV